MVVSAAEATDEVSEDKDDVLLVIIDDVIFVVVDSGDVALVVIDVMEVALTEVETVDASVAETMKPNDISALDSR